MDRVLSMLGLCARAGKLITGEKACVQAIRGGGAFVALLDGAASENAVKALSSACESHSVPLLRTEAFALGDAIGKPSRMAAAVTDARMAQRLIALSGGGDQGNHPNGPGNRP